MNNYYHSNKNICCKIKINIAKRHKKIDIIKIIKKTLESFFCVRFRVVINGFKIIKTSPIIDDKKNLG